MRLDYREFVLLTDVELHPMQPAFIICRLGGESGLASFIDRGAFETTSATKSGSSSPTARIGGVGRCPAIG